MSRIENSGLYYPNKFGMIAIKALEDVMGRNGLNAILNLAGLTKYIDSYPADNLEKVSTSLNSHHWVLHSKKCMDLAVDAVLRSVPDAQLSRMLSKILVHSPALVT
jgi:hypothetical protein